MDRRLLAAVALAVTAMAAYAGLAYYGHAVALAYSPISGAEPVFEPRVIEPLVRTPDMGPACDDPFGYESAVHNEKDDSVTITYFDRTDAQADNCVLPFWGPSPEATGTTHTQTYRVNSTFAYGCRDFEDHTKVLLYQYKGTSLFRGERSFVFVHFEVNPPERVPCAFPDYLVHTVDIYDASGFDEEYDLEYYEPTGGTADYIKYAEPVRYAVPISPLYMYPYPPSKLDGNSRLEALVTGVLLNEDDSITVTYNDMGSRIGASLRGTEHVATYEPGQTFLVHCEEREDTTSLAVYNYRGTETGYYGSEHGAHAIFASFNAYTRAPVPCTYPDVLVHSTDAFDASRLDRQYDVSSRLR